MEAIALLMLTGGAFFAAKAFGNVSKTTKTSSTQYRATGQGPNAVGYQLPTVTSDTDQVAATAKVVGGALYQAAQAVQSVPVVGAAATGVLIGATVGGKVTGDWMGAVAGGLNASGGNVANIGRIIGADIDRLFGGDGRTGTGVVSQVAGFMAGLALGVYGLMAFINFVPVAVIALSVASIVSDLTRLSYGQAGLLKDMLKEANDFLTNSVVEANKQLYSMGVYTAAQIQSADSQNRVQANAIALTIGYMQQRNKLLQQVWMKKPHGFLQDDAGHAKFATDRGIFLTQGSLAVLENQIISLRLGGGIYMAAITDVQRAQCKLLGRFLANGVAWQQALQLQWGFFINSWKNHLDWCAAQGLFDSDSILVGTRQTVDKDGRPITISADGDTVFGTSAYCVVLTRDSGKLVSYEATASKGTIGSLLTIKGIR